MRVKVCITNLEKHEYVKGVTMISAVMLNYKRPENVKKIISELKNNRLIGEIIIVDRSPAEQMSFLDTIRDIKVIKIDNDSAVGMHARWVACSQAKYDTIFMQDDDLLISSDAIKALYESWQRDPEIIHGIFGRKVNMICRYRYNNVQGEVEIVLTRAAVFHKNYAAEVLRKLPCVGKELSTITKKNGEDIFFSYFVMSKSHKKNKTHDLSKYVTELPDPCAIWSRLGHKDQRTRVTRLCRREFDIEYGTWLKLIMKKYELKNAICGCLAKLMKKSRTHE